MRMEDGERVGCRSAKAGETSGAGKGREGGRRQEPGWKRAALMNLQ